MRYVIAIALALSLLVPSVAVARPDYTEFVWGVRNEVGAPEWAVAACLRSLAKEHYACGGCAKCQRYAAKHRGHVGPLQYNSGWNKGHAGCIHGYSDWRYCLTCSVQKFMVVARDSGKRGVRRHWGQTCGRLRG